MKTIVHLVSCSAIKLVKFKVSKYTFTVEGFGPPWKEKLNMKMK